MAIDRYEQGRIAILDVRGMAQWLAIKDSGTLMIKATRSREGVKIPKCVKWPRSGARTHKVADFPHEIYGTYARSAHLV